MRYSMISVIFTCAITTAFVSAATLATDSRQTLQTEYLQPVVGARESVLGAQIINIEAGNDAVRIEISLPADKAEIFLVNEIEGEVLLEEMTVYGEPLVDFEPNLPNAAPQIDQVQDVEWVVDIERGEYGLVLYLPKFENFAFTVNYRNLAREQYSGFAPLSLKGSDKGR
jgi:hypothetical protein